MYGEKMHRGNAYCSTPDMLKMFLLDCGLNFKTSFCRLLDLACKDWDWSFTDVDFDDIDVFDDGESDDDDDVFVLKR